MAIKEKPAVYKFEVPACAGTTGARLVHAGKAEQGSRLRGNDGLSPNHNAIALQGEWVGPQGQPDSTGVRQMVGGSMQRIVVN